MNKTKVALVFLMFAVCGRPVTAASHHGRVLVRVPEAWHLFGISIAPGGHSLLLFCSHQKAEGEYVSGTAVLVRLKESPEVIPLKVPTTLEDAASAVWSRDGRWAYFLTTAGIYSLKAETAVPKLLLPGTFAGLAVSPDASRLAFWDLGSTGTSYTLRVFDLRSDRNVRTWETPTKYGSDQYGHEIVFSGDSSLVFARTYDEEDRTPLKQFEIASGKVRTVWPNCVGLAGSNREIYFIGSTAAAAALFELGRHDSSPRKVIAPFNFDTLLGNAAGRWIVATNNRTGATAVLDSERKALEPVSSHCDSAAVTAQGRIVCSEAGDLFFVNASLPKRSRR